MATSIIGALNLAQWAPGLGIISNPPPPQLRLLLEPGSVN